MRATRTRQLLALLATLFAIVMIGALPASAATVSCSDLRTQNAAQSYLDGHSDAASRLDADGDGRACEGNTATSSGSWTVLGLGALVVVVLVGNWVLAKRESKLATPERPTFLAPAGEREQVLQAAPAGSLADLARALRRLPYAARLPLLEEHALAHGLAPQAVLDDLVAGVDDLPLQRWALIGYGPPSHVRVLFCSCVGGARNFRLRQTTAEAHTWHCATCRLPAVVGIGARSRHQPIEQQPKG